MKYKKLNIRKNNEALNNLYNGPSEHELKIKPKYYVAVENGSKPFEVRKNDRDYKVGDILTLREYADGEYTGRKITMKITYILDDEEYLQPGYVVLGLMRDISSYMLKRVIK